MYAEEGSVWQLSMLIFNSPIFGAGVLTPQEYSIMKRAWKRASHIKLSERALRFAAGLVAPYTDSLPALDAESADWAENCMTGNESDHPWFWISASGAEPLAITACEVQGRLSLRPAPLQ